MQKNGVGTIRAFTYTPLLTLTDDEIPSPILSGQETQLTFIRHLISGTVTAVPEPSTTGFLALGVAALAFLRRRAS